MWCTALNGMVPTLFGLKKYRDQSVEWLINSLEFRIPVIQI